jgi:hypothetical protein
VYGRYSKPPGARVGTQRVEAAVIAFTIRDATGPGNRFVPMSGGCKGRRWSAISRARHQRPARPRSSLRQALKLESEGNRRVAHYSSTTC